MDLFVAFIVVVLVVLLFTFHWYCSAKSPHLPPGPRGLPIIGSALSTWRASTCFSTLNDWAKIYGSIFTVYIGNQLILVLGDYEAIHDALVKQGDAYLGRFQPAYLRKSSSIGGVGLVRAEGQLWKVQRRFALSTLRDLSRAIQIESRIEEEAEYLIADINKLKGRPFDITSLLDKATANVIGWLLFGNRFEYDDPEFDGIFRVPEEKSSWLKRYFNPSLLGRVFEAQVEELMCRFALGIRNKNNRRCSPTLDFVRNRICEAMSDFNCETDKPSNYIREFYKSKDTDGHISFTDHQLEASLIDLFGIGAETPTTLRWVIFYMCQFPEIQERVSREISNEFGGKGAHSNYYAERSKLPFTEAVLMEVHRLGCLFPVGPIRRSLESTVLRGFEIPAGTLIVPLFGALARDPSVFPNPHSFEPSRFLTEKRKNVRRQFAYVLPFSLGKRGCLGEFLARMELFIFFTALLAKCKFSFPTDVTKPPLDGPSGITRVPPKFKVCVEPRV